MSRPATACANAVARRVHRTITGRPHKRSIQTTRGCCWPSSSFHDAFAFVPRPQFDATHRRLSSAGHNGESPPPPSSSSSDGTGIVESAAATARWKRDSHRRIEEKFRTTSSNDGKKNDDHRQNDGDAATRAAFSSPPPPTTSREQWDSPRPNAIDEYEDVQPMWKEMESRVTRRRSLTHRERGGVSGRRNVRKSEEDLWLEAGVYEEEDSDGSRKA